MRQARERVLVVDKAVTDKNGHVVVADIDGEFVCKQLQLHAGRIELKAANPSYPDIVPKEGQEVWGVVTASIKTMPVECHAGAARHQQCLREHGAGRR